MEFIISGAPSARTGSTIDGHDPESQGSRVLLSRGHSSRDVFVNKDGNFFTGFIYKRSLVVRNVVSAINLGKLCIYLHPGAFNILRASCSLMVSLLDGGLSYALRCHNVGRGGYVVTSC